MEDFRVPGVGDTSEGDIHLLIISEQQCKFLVIDKSRVSPPTMADVKLVFYDLEWSQSEIIQIGAVCESSDFSQCIRPSGKIDPFVK